MVSFFIGALVGKFRVEEPVLDTFFPLSICGLIPVGTGWGDSVADRGFRRVFLNSFLRDSIVSRCWASYWAIASIKASCRPFICLVNIVHRSFTDMGASGLFCILDGAV